MTIILNDILSDIIHRIRSITESSTVSDIESMTSSEKFRVIVKVLGDDGALKKINH